VRFDVEAKKPSIALDRRVDAHLQTLRYGYSADTPPAVRTDCGPIHASAQHGAAARERDAAPCQHFAECGAA
jgi:hypothetical protein